MKGKNLWERIFGSIEDVGQGEPTFWRVIWWALRLYVPALLVAPVVAPLVFWMAIRDKWD